MTGGFDTNIVIDLLSGYPPALAEARNYTEGAISRITWVEVLVGAPDAATQQQWESFLAQFRLVEMDDAVCRDAIVLRKQQRLKLPDALIFASARRHGYLFVTRNTRDFPPGTPGVRVPYTR